METVKEIVTFAAPLVAGLLTSVVIPLMIKAKSIKRIQQKIDEVNEAEQLKNINKRLDEIEKNIYEMRGKRK